MMPRWPTIQPASTPPASLSKDLSQRGSHAQPGSTLTKRDHIYSREHDQNEPLPNKAEVLNACKEVLTSLQTSLGRARPPALIVGLLLDDLGPGRRPVYGDTAQLLPGLLPRDERVLEPVLQLPHNAVPINLRTAGDLLGVALRPVYCLSSPTLGPPEELRLGDHRVGLVVGFLDYALGLLLCRSDRGPAFPAKRLSFGQLRGQRSPQLVQHHKQIRPIDNRPSFAHRYAGCILNDRLQLIQHSAYVLHVFSHGSNPSTLLQPTLGFLKVFFDALPHCQV